MTHSARLRVEAKILMKKFARPERGRPRYFHSELVQLDPLFVRNLLTIRVHDVAKENLELFRELEPLFL